MHGWGMWGPGMLIPMLVVFMLFETMRHRWWSGACDHGHDRRRWDAMERESMLAPQDRDEIGELERRIAELESGLEFAERLLVQRLEGEKDHSAVSG